MAFKPTDRGHVAEHNRISTKLLELADGVQQAVDGVPGAVAVVLQPLADDAVQSAVDAAAPINDALIASLAANPASQFAIQQSATLGAQMDTEGTPLRDAADGLYRYGNLRVVTVADLPATGLNFYHRLGGLFATIAPEGTLEAAEQSLAMGSKILDVDVNQTQDGINVLQHDDTLDRMTGVTGNLADYPFPLLPKVDARYLVGDGWGTQVIPTVERIIGQMGGRVIVSTEPKNVASVATLVAFYKSRGLEKSVIINSSDATVIKAATDAGVVGYQWGITSTSGVDAAIAAGASFIDIMYANLNPTLVDYAKSRKSGTSLKWIMGSNIRKRVERDYALSLGVDGLNIDSAGYIDATPARKSIAQEIAAQKVGVGWWHNVFSRSFPVLVPTGISLSLAGGLTRRVLLGSISGPKPGTYSATFKYVMSAFSAAGGGTRPSLLLAVPDDSGDGQDGSMPGGYAFRVRASGNFEAFKRGATLGSYTALGTVTTTPAVADGEEVVIRVDVTPTTIKFVRLIGATEYVISGGAAGVFTDSAWRGDYIWVAGSTGGAVSHPIVLTACDLTY